MRILFVENHPRFPHTVIPMFLGDDEVVLVPSLSEARAALSSATFDALLVDFDLDDGKGDVLVREVRQAGSKVTIIAVSATDHGNEALCAAGADAICRKTKFRQIREVIASARRP